MHVIRECPLPWDKIDRWIAELKELIASRQETEIIVHLQRMVPEYNPAASGGRQPMEIVPTEKPAELRSVS
jgi:hypothetical protein